MYLTYNEYTTMGGSEVTQDEFPKYEFLAESLIDWFTFNRLQGETTIPEKVKKLMWILIDMVKKKETAISLGVSVNADGNLAGNVTSQANDGVSISYNGMSAGDVYTVMGNECKAIIEQQLYGVVNSLGRRLLYRGLYPGE